MMRLVVLMFSIGILHFVTSNEKVEDLDPGQNLVFPGENQKENYTTCTTGDVQGYVSEYYSCFIDKKYEDGGKDLGTVIGRILEHSEACVKKSSQKCRPNMKGFAAVMDNLIRQMRDRCHVFLKHAHKEREKIKDLHCVQESLSTEIYQSCFKTVFVRGIQTSEEKFQQKVESAISCTHKSLKSCSVAAKASMNAMVRTILRVEQHGEVDKESEAEPKILRVEQHREVDKESEAERTILRVEQPGEVDKESEAEPKNLRVEQPVEVNKKSEAEPEPPKRWYDVVFQPFIKMWRAIKSFFGF